MAGLEDCGTNTADETSASEAGSVIEAANLKLKMVKAKVKKLVKQQKLRLVGKLVQQANGDEPWGPAIQVKVQDPDVYLHMKVDLCSTWLACAVLIFEDGILKLLESYLQVGSRLLELMLETSVMRPPADQSAQDMTELRPAFKHTLRNYPVKNKNK